MDIKTLEALGVSAEDLAERIVDQAVHALLYSTGVDDNEEERTYASQFKREIEKRVQEAVDAKISALAAEHVIPRVGELIEQADMQQTSRYGEPKGEKLTFKEYIASRAQAYMTEDVNSSGESKAECRDSYSFRVAGPRLTVLMRLYIQQTLEKHAKEAVSDVNKVIAQNIEKAAKAAIASAADAIKVRATIG